MRYEWAEGCHFSAKQYDPSAIGNYIKKHHIDTANKFLDDAGDPKSPLHGFIEWDADAAAREHQLSQARLVIRSLKVVIVKTGGHTVKVKAFTHLPSQNAYTHVAKLQSKKDLRDEALRNALMDMKAFVRRFDSYKDLANIGRAALKSLERLTKRKAA